MREMTGLRRRRTTHYPLLAKFLFNHISFFNNIFTSDFP